MPVQSYQDLNVWQGAMTLAEQAYLLTKDFPRGELFGMTSQIRRAASSIPANIAEGWGRASTPEFLQVFAFRGEACENWKPISCSASELA
jgi:four helix bundle protein